MSAIVIKKFTNARRKNAPSLVFMVWGWPHLMVFTLAWLAHSLFDPLVRCWRIRCLTRWCGVGAFVVPVDVGVFVVTGSVVLVLVVMLAHLSFDLLASCLLLYLVASALAL